MVETPKTDAAMRKVIEEALRQRGFFAAHMEIFEMARMMERENNRLRALLARAFPIIERHAPVSPILADIAKELPDE